MNQLAVGLCYFLLFFCVSSCDRSRKQPPDEYSRTCDADLDPGEILHDYKTKNFGCLLTCTILSPSSAKYIEFLNHFALKTHRLSGPQCINETYVSGHLLLFSN